jgi:uncharacterized protein YqfA (UPF0365 family)
MNVVFAQDWMQSVTDSPILKIVLAILLIVALVFLLIFFSFLRVWINSVFGRARVGLRDMVRMKLMNIDHKMIVRQKIALVQAGVSNVTSQEMEAHFLSNGNVENVVAAVIAAHKAGLDLPWRTAATIDLAGRDILEAVRMSVKPVVIPCPDPRQGKEMLEGFCRNGIQLKARALVTVRAKLDRLVGGADRETIVARVGEGIVKAIGNAEHHTDILANPNMISKAVLVNSLDAQTAFEIVSVDVAEIDVGKNVGAELQINQAQADQQVALAQAATRKAAAQAREQEMRALVEENKAKVVEAESEVPLAIAAAFRDGRISVTEYYNLRNLQSDTEMRRSIAGSGANNDRTTERLNN